MHYKPDMAHENLYRFIDIIVRDFYAAQAKNDYRGEREAAQTLIKYYETVLAPAKYRTQRDYCKSKLKEISPALWEGYFKPRAK
jgi:hypothetical protein